MDCSVTSDGSAELGALIVSEVRFLRESLSEVLDRSPGIQVRGHSATLSHALVAGEALRPEIILLDAAFPSGIQAAGQLSVALPQASVVVLAVVETEANVLAWAEAGVAGYIANTASVDELVSQIGQISRGEQSCPSRIVGSLLRRIAQSGRGQTIGPPGIPPLTRRELEILRLVGAGLSNKDIARRLSISLGTTKSHVHNLLGKLSLQRRTEVLTHIHALRHAGLETNPV
jgi:two-component system, NarL family, nitrate/nitrite response regulator NarL